MVTFFLLALVVLSIVLPTVIVAYEVIREECEFRQYKKTVRQLRTQRERNRSRPVTQQEQPVATTTKNKEFETLAQDCLDGNFTLLGATLRTSVVRNQQIAIDGGLLGYDNDQTWPLTESQVFQVLQTSMVTVDMHQFGAVECVVLHTESESLTITVSIVKMADGAVCWKYTTI